MRAYYVQYTMHRNGEAKGIQSPADSKAEAYDKAVYELIPQKEGTLPYSAWVSSVTYNNGNYKTFNNFGGHPY